jgi:anaerobic selenocysteine-containing dehydrogenase
MTQQTNNAEEKWIPTSCNGCFNVCAVQVKVKDNKVVKVKGDPTAQSSRKKICGKGIAKVAEPYAPNRILKPLKRTNPEKGIGVDPKWKEISWDEAMDTVIEKLKKVQQDDPRKLVIGHFDLHNAQIAHAFGGAFGTPNCEYFTVSCGNGLHTLLEVTAGTINLEIDLELCDYIVLWGSQLGHGVNNNPMESARDMANARRRGAKLVVIDPICGHAAAKADEWIPILPGTDGALALGMLNVLLNDLCIYDSEYLKKNTNAPYLIDGSGYYVRDKKSNKPLVWDTVNKTPKEYDADDIADRALEGEFTVDNVTCKPAFDLVKAYIKENYPLDKVSQITTVPEKVIARLAKEFGEAAGIGRTITIDGHELPLRPAAVEFKKGVNQHKNSFFSCHCLMLLNIVVGNVNMPGGVIGTNPKGPFNLWDVIKSQDGLLTTNVIPSMTGGEGSYSCFLESYPAREIKIPDRVDYRDLFPLSGYVTTITTFVLSDPDKFKLPYKPNTMIISRTNLMASTVEPPKTAQALLNMDFILGFGMKMDETLEFADIVLPEAHDLERDWLFPANIPAGFLQPGPGEWYFQINQAVVDPPPGVRSWLEVMGDIAERLGILDEFNNRLNIRLGLGMVEQLALKPGTKYSIKEIALRAANMLSGLAGQALPPDMFTEKNPVLSTGNKSVEEAYPGAFTSDAKVPIYFEHFLDAGKKIKKVTQEMGMDWWDVSHYDPMPKWRPCPAFEEDGKEYDLFIANSKIPLHFQTTSADNPWINDICSRNRLDYNLLLNTRTAKEKGIQDGDTVIVESRAGKVKGKVRVTECVHPQVIGTLGIHGHWSKGKPIAKGKGVNFNTLVPFDFNNMGMISGQLDNCARVKIYKVS